MGELFVIVGRLFGKIAEVLLNYFLEGRKYRVRSRASLRLRVRPGVVWEFEDSSGSEIPTLVFTIGVLREPSVIFYDATIEVTAYKRPLDSLDRIVWASGPPALHFRDSTGDVTLPHRVEAGDRLSVQYDAREITRCLRNTGRRRSWLKLTVEDGLDNYHCKIFPVPDVEGLANSLEYEGRRWVGD